MFELLKTLLEKTEPDLRFQTAREFMQVLILKIIFDNGFFANVAFVGGTALRIIFDMRRFSEDIDFSLIDKANFNFDRMAKTINTNLNNYGFSCGTSIKKNLTVNAAELRFVNFLYPLELSKLKNQKLLIKLEIDTNPPKGFLTELSAVNKMSLVFTATHFDLSSSFATKLHACFYRKYTKGRDFYDLIWYLGKNITPNFTLLNDAIKQTQKMDPKIDKENFREFLLKQLDEVDFKQAKKDVERFLIDKNELRFFDKEIIAKIIK